VLALKGVDIILNPSASHFAFGKRDVRQRFVLEGSRAFSCSYLYSNLLGNEAGRAIYDGGALIASGGALLAAGPRFSFTDFELTTATIDVDLTRTCQARTASFRPRLADRSELCVRDPFKFSEAAPQAAELRPEDWELSLHLKEEEFARAIALALFDYVRKSRSQGFVLSLSGGADSSAVACLVAILVHLARSQLGPRAFQNRLAHIAGLDSTLSNRELVHRLLVCVYQATRNSSARTEEAARSVAGALGAEFVRLDVDAMATDYQRLVSQAVGRELNWETDDIALQNIQARVRAPGIWLLANIRGALLLATSNRSEAAVGYATMDGDTCGGLSPIAGIDKAFLRRWLDWLEHHGPTGIGPIPALSAVNTLTPTAELRPPSAAQSDEDDLMPYVLLDAVERAAIRDRQTPLEVFRRLRGFFPRYSTGQLAVWVERFFVLWSRNQWKRERYAPSFHVDDENLDPKTWCRFPILSGAFARELAELREYVQRLSAKSAVSSTD
jgi:NAD+ synthase (glutamine-hydrolysing)